MMLELGSVEMAAVVWLCLGASLTCVVYGIKNWNNSGRVKQGDKDGR
ncbi:MAG: hypothetical protein ACNI27_14500 [Desulfovibrio sp.]